MASLADVVKRIEAYYCLDCGKCTGVCPVSRVSRDFSPRTLLLKAIRGDRNDLFADRSIWSCLACGLCDEKCPSGIRYIELTKAIRLEAHHGGVQTSCSHGGAFQSLMRIMTSPQLNQNRLEWLTGDMKVTTHGDVLYFVGCAPYFDAFFSDIGVSTLTAAKSSIRLLNAMGIEPVVLPNERCCGHDLLWSGDLEGFKRLAEHNLQAIEKSGAKKVIFSCPEGYRTFKLDYPEHFGPLKFSVEHISELLASEISKGSLKLQPGKRVVTYQDPCRLGRHLGIYEEPRAALLGIPELELREMPRSKKNAICCGVSAWLNCDSCTKLLQLQRLAEAESTGAELLVTACPKCEIHFRCAMSGQDDGVKVEIKDLTTVIVEALAGVKAQVREEVKGPEETQAPEEVQARKEVRTPEKVKGKAKSKPKKARRKPASKSK